MFPEIYGLRLKISRLVQISGVCQKISIMCPETLIVQKYFVCFLSYDTTNFQIAYSFWHDFVNFEHVLENFKISKNFWHLYGNFQHVSGIFFFILNEEEYFFIKC